MSFFLTHTSNARPIIPCIIVDVVACCRAVRAWTGVMLFYQSYQQKQKPVRMNLEHVWWAFETVQWCRSCSNRARLIIRVYHKGMQHVCQAVPLSFKFMHRVCHFNNNILLLILLYVVYKRAHPWNDTCSTDLPLSNRLHSCTRPVAHWRQHWSQTPSNNLDPPSKTSPNKHNRRAQRPLGQPSIPAPVSAPATVQASTS